MKCFVLKFILALISLGTVQLFGSKFLLNVNTHFTLLELDLVVLLEILKVLVPCLLVEGSK